MKQITLLFILMTSSILAQNVNEIKALAMKQANETAKATLNLDYEGIAQYTHPNIIKAMGGKEKMVSILKQTFGNMKEAGMSFVKSETGEMVSFGKEQGEYRCVVTNYLEMTLSAQKMKVKRYSSIFGFYDSNVKQWTFVEANKVKDNSLKQFLPNFKTELSIPEDRQETETL